MSARWQLEVFDANGALKTAISSIPVHGHTGASDGGQLNAGSVFSAGQVPLARGGTNADLSATGGTGQYLKQSSAAAAVTVGTIPDADLPTTLAGKTLTTPTIASFANATHDHQSAAGGGVLSAYSRFAFGGRLTLTTGTPVTTSDVTAAGTLYYTPYLHGYVPLYDGTNWLLYVFTERSLSLTLTSGKNYDVFLYNNSGTLTLELSAAWTNDTTRADALTTQNGITVKSGATTRLWLGTIRASGTNTTEDSTVKRFVWNAFNRVPRQLQKLVTTASWTYGTATWRQANAAAANQVEMVRGANDDDVTAFWTCSVLPVSGNLQFVGVGLDSTSALAADATAAAATGSSIRLHLRANYDGYPGLGYHYLAALEYAQATVTYEGNNVANLAKVGGVCWA